MPHPDPLPPIRSQFRGLWFFAALLLIPLSLWAMPQDGPDLDNPGQTTPSASSAGEAEAAEETGDAPAENADGETEDSGEDASSNDPEANVDSEAEDDESTAFWKSGAIGLLLDGGLFMWPILLMGVLATGVIIERYRSLRMVQADSGNVRDRVLRLLREDRVEDALLLCESEEGPVPAVLSSGLRRYYVLRRLDYDPAAIEPQVVKAMDDYGVHIAAALEKNLAILATVSSAAPMLGFLGTVQGMIVAFKDIVDQMGETNIVAAAAQGIQVSLLTTCFGLIVGIPAFIAFNYFTSVTNRYVLDVEESATDLVESVTLQMAFDRRPASTG